MNARSIRMRAATATLATVMALGASAAIAQGKSDSGSEESELPLATRACQAAGCSDGSRPCGSVSWSEWIWIWTPWLPIPWKITETASCYEPREN